MQNKVEKRMVPPLHVDKDFSEISGNGDLENYIRDPHHFIFCDNTSSHSNLRYQLWNAYYISNSGN